MDIGFAWLMIGVFAVGTLFGAAMNHFATLYMAYDIYKTIKGEDE